MLKSFEIFCGFIFTVTFQKSPKPSNSFTKQGTMFDEKGKNMCTCLDNSGISYDLSMIDFGAATAIVSKRGLCTADCKMRNKQSNIRA